MHTERCISLSTQNTPSKGYRQIYSTWNVRHSSAPPTGGGGSICEATGMQVPQICCS